MPTICIRHPSEAAKCACVIAVNRLGEFAGWDNRLLRIKLGELVDVDLKRDLSFDLDVIGFEIPVIGVLLSRKWARPLPAERFPRSSPRMRTRRLQCRNDGSFSVPRSPEGSCPPSIGVESDHVDILGLHSGTLPDDGSAVGAKLSTVNEHQLAVFDIWAISGTGEQCAQQRMRLGAHIRWRKHP